ncbi:MAG: hypothetical protein EH225_04255 [Calditrichaeota bacterium]|nr:hypothetical protein [Calditrichota bacterium]RQW05797.1 MAG: hypothetical protein EH225_04255 [Calditrichota bacterium]
MNSREKIRTIIAGEPADRCGFWLGNPHPDTWPLLHRYFGTSSEEELRLKLGDDMCWINPESSYRHPAGKPIFDKQRTGPELSAPGIFANCDNVKQILDFEWPNPDYLDFTEIIEELKRAKDFYCASGFWCPFFHDVADFFGMENYFLKMYTHPEVVHACTKQIVDFYAEANERFFGAITGLVDGFFFGNDFGTQLDLLISPEMFREFIVPYFRQLIEGARRYNLQIILHSCGAISRILPDILELNVDALHPLQARAVNMNARFLADNFKGKLAFIGGIDTQELLINATPEEVKAEVRRVKEILGPCYVVSPSHEAILPNIPPENIMAMAEAAME